ncbi:hypothetical protein GPK44_09750 [Bifidobacterium longum]|nr:hypothetical protein [Bifidobacterium longum]
MIRRGSTGSTRSAWTSTYGATPATNRYVTVVVDLTPRKHDRPARLLDMVEGGSEKAFASWLAERPQSFRDHVKAIAMDAFAGYKKAARHGAPRGGGIGVFRQVGVSCLVMYFFRV